MSEHSIDVDATIKRLHEHSARIEAIKQRMLRRELDPADAWAQIRALPLPYGVRVYPVLQRVHDLCDAWAKLARDGVPHKASR